MICEKCREELKINTNEMVKVADFEIGKYPVTQELWESIMGNNPSKFKGKYLPVDSVSWYDAVEFCNKMSEKEGLQKVYSDDYGPRTTCDFTANGYRLPTVNEWKFASEGGKKSRGYKYSGNDDINEVAWDDCSSDGQTHEVGMKKPNELGIYDMHGNVWEWCWDSFCGSNRRIRGGSCLSDADTCTEEYHESPWVRSKDLIGFRLVRTLPTKEPEIRREDKTFEEKPVVSREDVAFPSVKKPETKVTPVVESGSRCNTSGLTAQQRFNKQCDIYQTLVNIDEKRFASAYMTDMCKKYGKGVDLPSESGFNYNAWKHIKL